MPAMKSLRQTIWAIVLRSYSDRSNRGGFLVILPMTHNAAIYSRFTLWLTFYWLLMVKCFTSIGKNRKWLISEISTRTCYGMFCSAWTLSFLWRLIIMCYWCADAFAAGSTCSNNIRTFVRRTQHRKQVSTGCLCIHETKFSLFKQDFWNMTKRNNRRPTAF